MIKEAVRNDDLKKINEKVISTLTTKVKTLDVNSAINF